MKPPLVYNDVILNKQKVCHKKDKKVLKIKYNVNNFIVYLIKISITLNY